MNYASDLCPFCCPGLDHLFFYDNDIGFKFIIQEKFLNFHFELFFAQIIIIILIIF